MCDVVIGEMAQVADYIVPDVTQYESFGLPSGGGSYGAEVRWQAKTPETPELEDGSYLCWETLLIDVAKACGLPGWGEDAIPDAEGAMHPFNNAADYYLKAVANLAYADDARRRHRRGRDEAAGARRAPQELQGRGERGGVAEGPQRALARGPCMAQRVRSGARTGGTGS